MARDGGLGALRARSRARAKAGSRAGRSRAARVPGRTRTASTRRAGRTRAQAALRGAARRAGKKGSPVRAAERARKASTRAARSPSRKRAARSGTAHVRGGTTRTRPTRARTTGASDRAAATGSSSATSPLRQRARETFPDRSHATRIPGRPTRTTRTTTGAGSAGATRATLQAQIQQLQSRFLQMQDATSLTDVGQNVGRLDARLSELPLELNALRSRGYVHAGLLNEDIASLEEQWNEIRPRVEKNLALQRRRLQRQLNAVSRQVNALSPTNAQSLAAAQQSLNSLQSDITSARSGLTGLYSGLLSQLNLIEQTLERYDWVVEQFDRSASVRLRDTEAPLMAAEAEWERDGDEGPDGLLLLTDQRLLFEQNEAVATGKLFGLITTDSKKVQELLLDIPVHQIEQIAHSERGGFLGMGRTEILELVLSPRAPVSRARFELREQDSADWAVWLKRVQSGEIDRDRDEAYRAEVEAAAARAATFPTQCPSCFGPLPEAPRGAERIHCPYCGVVITPEDDIEAGYETDAT